MKRSREWITKGFAVIVSISMLIPAIPINTASAAVLNYNQTSTLQAKDQYETTKEIINELTNNLISFYGETSLEYAIIDEGEIVFSGSQGYANKETKTTPVSSTMYGIGSISKIYTTVAVMQLVEQGKVDLDQAVTQYIPEFTMADERYKDITVRMLLNHSSGLMGSTVNNSMLLGDIDQTTTDSLIEILKNQRLKADPGTIAVYCNDGFTLAELLVEHVTGMSFTQYVHRNIISPLEAVNTNTSDELFVTKKLAKIYSSSGERLPRVVVSCIGAGGIYSTAEELCYFAEIFMKNDNGLLDSTSTEAMSNAEYRNGIHLEDPDAMFTFGLGWDNVSLNAFSQYGIQALHKGGDNQFYHSSMIVLPEENIAMTILSVGGASIYNKMAAEEILLTYLEETGHIERKDDAKNSIVTNLPVETMPEEYKKYSGFYASISLVCQVEISNNLMKYTNLTYVGSTAELKYVGDGWFQYEDGQFYMKLVKESNGKVYLYTKETSVLPMLGSMTAGVFLAQKLEDYEVSQESLNAWLTRSHKKYLLVSEKYSSYIYGLDLMIGSLPSKEDLILEKYFGMLKVVDETHLTMDLQIPMVYGRDLSEYSITEVDGVEYLKQNESVFVDKESISTLVTKGSFAVNIPENGYAQYYSIPKDCEGKIIQVKLAEDTTFVVYNASGIQIRNSYLDQNNKVTLPSGGYIVFVGDVGAEFRINYLN